MIDCFEFHCHIFGNRSVYTRSNVRCLSSEIGENVVSSMKTTLKGGKCISSLVRSPTTLGKRILPVFVQSSRENVYC